MSEAKPPVAVDVASASARATPSIYPEPFASRMASRVKQPFGSLLGLSNFGVNLTRSEPGATSTLRHAHALQDEFIYVLQGAPTLVTDRARRLLASGMCAGFKASSLDAHHMVNESDRDAVYLEVGDRTAGDSVMYPDDDLVAVGTADWWSFAHKNGAPYQ